MSFKAKNQQTVKKTSGNNNNQEQSEELLLENSPFNSINNLGGVSQRSTSMSFNNLNDITSTQQDAQHNRKWDRDHTVDQIIGNPNVRCQDQKCNSQ